MAKAGVAVRVVASRAIDEVLRHGRSVDDALSGLLLEKEQDASLARMLVYGTLRYYWALQGQLDIYLSKPLRRRDKAVEALILLGLFQLQHSRIPQHAAVAATVDACRELGFPKLSGLVNAILRRALREPAEASTDSARWNHPEWIIQRLRDDWPDDWQAILAANDERSPMWLRVNRLRTSRDDYAAMLDAAGIAAATVAALPDALCLDEPLPVDSLPGFAEGLVSIQDGGAQLAAPWMLQDRRGRFLDACAAPGGKSAHCLELKHEHDALTCIEQDPERAKRIHETFERLGLDAPVLTADASRLDDWWDGEPFSAILLDAPCSASGVIRRHPDIKLLRRDTDLQALTALQTQLLESLWSVLEPGGRLLYVTCSVFAVENDELVSRWLKAHPEARENDVLHNNNIRDVMRRKACGYQLLPGTQGLDGFYFACLEKAT